MEEEGLKLSSLASESVSYRIKQIVWCLTQEDTRIMTIIIIIIAKGNLTNLLGKGINCSHIQCKGNLELISLEKWTLWGLPGGSPGAEPSWVCPRPTPQCTIHVIIPAPACKAMQTISSYQAVIKKLFL